MSSAANVFEEMEAEIRKDYAQKKQEQEEELKSFCSEILIRLISRFWMKRQMD